MLSFNGFYYENKSMTYTCKGQINTFIIKVAVMH